MIKKSIIISLVFSLTAVVVFGQLVDQKATPQTKALYQILQKFYGGKVLIGHQDALAYGVGWSYQEGRSDIKDLTGAYPAVFGWDLGGLEDHDEQNLDGVPFANMKEYIKKAYDMGAINTLSWHMNNPINGKNAWDVSKLSVKSILPNGVKHKLYKAWLNNFATFINSARGSDGKLVPILFRPFHENGGGWFWWGSKSCTPEEYKALWRFTVTYLKDKRRLHNLIYVFNPCDFKSEAEYLSRYPGNEYVDVLSFDAYQGAGTSGDLYLQKMVRMLSIQHQIANKNKKISAVAETGFVEIPDPKWWTGVFMKAIEQYKPSYVLFWRNAGYRKQENDNHYYAPYPGQVSADDFLKFTRFDQIILQDRLEKYSIYK